MLRTEETLVAPEYFYFDNDHDTQCVTCYGCYEHSRSKIREEYVDEARELWRSGKVKKAHDYKKRLNMRRIDV